MISNALAKAKHIVVVVYFTREQRLANFSGDFIALRERCN